MELSFLLIANYKDGLLEKQGFNFDNRFNFSCNEVRKNAFELVVKENPNYIEDFFKPENTTQLPYAKIRNITAIVGENGAGKTSVLDYIKENIVFHETSMEKESPFLYIIRDYDQESFKHYIFHHPSIEISIIGNFHYELNSTSYREFLKFMTGTTFIFFSNIYDLKNEDASPHLLNISTNYLASTRQRNHIKQGIIPKDHLRHKYREIERQVQFVYGMNNPLNQKTLPFQVPKEFNIYFVRNNNRGLDVSEDGDSIVHILRKMQVNIKRVFGIGEEKKPYQYICQSILNHIYNEIIYSLSDDKYKYLKFDPSLITESAGKSASYIFLKTSRWLLNLATHLKKNGDPEILKVSRLIESSVAIMIRLYGYVKKGFVGFDTERNLITFSLNIESVPEGEINRIFELYQRSYLVHDYFEFLWRDISSGENALLNIYSRFYYASYVLSQYKTKQDIIVLIDEGEIYLHPHWQSQLLNNLVEYFPYVFSEQKNIQIILTSNSPFIISDLPSSNVIFLKKNMKNNQSVVLDGLDDYHQTFAANIHTLLSHTFFMNDGLCGSFAKRKINAIVHRLVNESIHTLWPDRDNIEKFINIIGEPVIRNKLLSMLQDKLVLKMLNVDQEFSALRTRIEDLERWKNDTDQQT